MDTSLPAGHLNDPVAKHMRQEFVRLMVNQTVGEAMAGVRERPPEGRIIYYYVVDDEEHPRGVVPTRRLLLSPPDRPVAEIMVKEVIAIPATATVLEACEFFTLHRLLAFPIVDDQRRVLGVVDVELYTAELGNLERSERNDQLFQLIGAHLTEAQQTSSVLSFKSRFPWLLCNVGGGILAAFLSGLYEAEPQKVVALALFIPAVLALAESVSVQSVSLALQTLGGHAPTWSVLRHKVSQEALTGLFLGMASGGVVALGTV